MESESLIPKQFVQGQDESASDYFQRAHKYFSKELSSVVGYEDSDRLKNSDSSLPVILLDNQHPDMDLDRECIKANTQPEIMTLAVYTRKESFLRVVCCGNK